MPLSIMKESIIIFILACEEGELRLVEGHSVTNGRVEICIEERWGTVCGDSWDIVEVEVICRQLDYLESGRNFNLFTLSFICTHACMHACMVFFNESV